VLVLGEPIWDRN